MVDDSKPQAPTVSLYSVQAGKEVEYELSVAENGEILATHEDSVLKFPAGLGKKELKALFDAHNEANEGKVALTEEELAALEEGEALKSKAAEDSQKLIDSL